MILAQADRYEEINEQPVVRVDRLEYFTLFKRIAVGEASWIASLSAFKTSDLQQVVNSIFSQG